MDQDTTQQHANTESAASTGRRNKMLTIFTAIGLLVLLVLYSTTYTVAYHEVAVVTRFGPLHEVRTDPGLALKLPFFADRVTKYDTRLQLIESSLKTVATSDDEQLVVRVFMLWRVNKDDEQGVRDFYSTHASIDAARTFLSSQLEDTIGALSRYAFSDLLGETSRLPEAEQQMASLMRDKVVGHGIDIAFVGVSQMLFPPRTSKAVLDRMKTTRERLADAERIRGTAEATSIQSDLRTKMGKIRAFATQRAAEIRAQAATRSVEYIRQLNQESELAIFLAWIDALEQSLSKNTTIVLDANMEEPFHLMNLHTQVNAKGIPVPNDAVAAETAPAVAQRPAAPAVAGSDGDADEQDADASNGSSTGDAGGEAEGGRPVDEVDDAEHDEDDA
jgi:modulator of FtsH protease HflC